MEQLKKILLLIAVSTAFLNTKAQTVNNIPINELDVDYVQIVGTSKLMSNKLTIEIDFGQNTKFFSSGKEEIM